MERDTCALFTWTVLSTSEEPCNNVKEACTELWILLHCRSHSAAADTAVASLQTAYDDLGDVNTFIASVSALRNGLQDFVDGVGTSEIDAVQNANSAVGARLSGLSLDLTSISNDLDGFSSVYDEYSPCLSALVDKMVSINTTLLR